MIKLRSKIGHLWMNIFLYIAGIGLRIAYPKGFRRSRYVLWYSRRLEYNAKLALNVNHNRQYH